MSGVRKPNSLKILDGDRKDRINLNEPKSPVGLGEPPEWFDSVEREAWEIIKSRVEEMGVATRADSESVVLYCQNYAMARTAKKSIDEIGLMIIDTYECEKEGKRGAIQRTTRSTHKVNPMVRIYNESVRHMTKILCQFGMTPASRSSLHVETKPEADPLMTFLATGTTNGKRGR